MDKQSRFLFLRSFWHLGFAAALFAATLYVTFTNSYMEFRDVEVQVVDKLETRTGKALTPVFYLIVKNDEFGTFDIPVGPALYQRAETNGTLVFTLREFDARQTFRQNLVYFFGQIILWVMSGLYIFVTVVTFLPKGLK